MQRDSHLRNQGTTTRGNFGGNTGTPQQILFFISMIYHSYSIVASPAFGSIREKSINPENSNNPIRLDRLAAVTTGSDEVIFTKSVDTSV